jgi:hypothetical protein
MTAFTPEYLVKINGTEVTDVTLANLTITSGRTDINSQPVAGYCQIQLINFNNQSYPFNVGTGLTVEVKNTSGTFIPIFGGYVTDYQISVNTAGALGSTTLLTIVALGALSKLPKFIDPGVLSKDYDGDQIYTLLSGYLLAQWNEVPAAQTWAAYDPTITWANAGNIGLGEIDQPGNYEMIARSADLTDIYSLVSQIATSALGYIYEDANGNIGYASSTHRQDYLANNGYVELDAGQALASGISTTVKSGDIRNRYTIGYGGGNNTYTAEDLQSQSFYGLQAQSFTSNIDKLADATIVADRYVALRSFPSAKFESITFPLGNPEIDNTDRDALLNVFMGMPVWLQNLPPNINDGSFQGYVEGWTFRASVNDLSLTFNASPVNFSQVAVKWEQVNAAETWNTLNTSLTWLNAIGAVA